MSVLKRQREQRKNEKAARKRAKRHGIQREGFTEPTPTLGIAELLGLKPVSEEPEPEDAEEDSAEQLTEDSAIK